MSNGQLYALKVSDKSGNGPVELVGQSAAKAWATFNGVSSTSIRDSFNVSSLTDEDVGVTTVNMTNAMESAHNYSLSGYGSQSTSYTNGSFNSGYTGLQNRQTTSFVIYVYNGSVGVDSYYNDGIAHGDLA